MLRSHPGIGFLLRRSRLFLRAGPGRILTETRRRNRQTRDHHDADGTDSYRSDWNSTLEHLPLTLKPVGQKKAQLGAGTVIFLDLEAQCQFRLG